MRTPIELVDRKTGEVLAFRPRFNAESPCPICGKPTSRRRESYCLCTDDRAWVVCGHASAGGRLLSPTAGRLFKIDDHAPERNIGLKKPPAKKLAAGRNFRDIVARAIEQAKGRLSPLADELGVSERSLTRLGVGIITASELHALDTTASSTIAYTFPMVDGQRRLIGVRLRAGAKKYAITGSRNGLFWPGGLTGWGPLVMPEGPSDTAKMLDLGFDAIGRPAAKACVEMGVEAARGRDLVAIADYGDTPAKGQAMGDGQAGAIMLAEAAAADRQCLSAKWIYPPSGKDARDCNQGAKPWMNAIDCASLVIAARRA